MKKKLTLTIEESVKQRAKQFARAHQTSISAIVEKYLASVTKKEDFQPEAGSITESLMSSVKMPEEYKGKSYKEIKREQLRKKYG